ncbi:PKD domain-containing protein [Cellulomonas aerilata]|uniref:PKD domain-containing protein n=1 Tax=Cellulomonas aerilata TaxID=515326 RepID=A0A512D8T1_9CELL|nr:PKD domain-containing protein [Cellulomonas aerilata]GEO32807.1 hypothetical protein CAE01nite_05320 [Cellulomonas aerilata]
MRGRFSRIVAATTATWQLVGGMQLTTVEPPITRTFLDQDTAVVRARQGFSPTEHGRPDAGPRTEEYRRSPALICGIDNELRTLLRLVVDCTAPVNRVLSAARCAPGEIALDPLFRRTQDPSTPGRWTNWDMIDSGCVSQEQISAAVAEAFQRLPLSPSHLSVQPPSGWTLVNADTVAFADDAEQTLPTTVLGLAVTIRAVPATFTWTFGDGSAPLVTTEPGRPWPDHTIAHRYTAEGTRTISLTTTWTATFQIGGSPEWSPVDGTAITTSAAPPVTVYEARSRLVSESAG